MANAAKVAVVLGTILVLLQVSSCAADRNVRDAPAVMTLKGFQKGEGVGLPASCDGKFHSDGLLLASMTSGWYGGCLRCGKMIRIEAGRGRVVEAMVVDECDIEQGCGVHEIRTSAAVWKALGIEFSFGQVKITWSDLN